MTNNLAGSTALVTGGTSGIGRATALALARLAAHVVLSGRDVARGEQVVEAIRAERGRADFVAVDLSDEASARQLARQATELGNGHVDILVNNAGIFPFGPTHEASEADFDRVYAVSPGPTRTEGTALMGEALDQLASAAPSGRPGLPEEIAAAITYLASHAASFVHGAVLPVDGGRIAV
jgi:NAD(P)-dependent dehydrogenase (short-subunit alcohol dehydrogenase family)